MSFDFGQDLCLPERPGDIIDGPGIEALDLDGYFFKEADEDDGNHATLLVGFQTTADLVALHVRQLRIEQDQIGCLS